MKILFPLDFEEKNIILSFLIYFSLNSLELKLIMSLINLTKYLKMK